MVLVVLVLNIHIKKLLDKKFLIFSLLKRPNQAFTIDPWTLTGIGDCPDLSHITCKASHSPLHGKICMDFPESVVVQLFNFALFT